jgi:translocation and assembly module TamB
VIRRLLKWLFLLFVLLLCGIAWLVGSESGNRQLISRIPVETLKIEHFEGFLLSQMTLQGLIYDDGTARVKIDRLSLAWNPMELFDRVLHVQTLNIGNIHYTALKPSPDSESETALPSLPVTLKLDQALLNELIIETGGEQQTIRQISTSLSTQEQQVQIAALAAQYNEVNIAAKGDLTLVDQIPFSIAISWHGKLPELGESAGEGKISGDLTALSIEHLVSQPTRLTTTGSIGLADKEVTLDLQGDWNDIGWPLTGPREYSSQTGSYRISGPVSLLHVDMTADLAFSQPDIPPMTLEVATDIESTGLKNLNAQTSLLGGTVSTSGSFAWSPYPAWDLAVIARQINPADQWPDWPGLLDLNADIQGRIQESALSIDGRIEQLSGLLRDYPLKASGGVHFENDTLDLQAIQIDSGPNKLLLNGLFAQSPDLKFTINAPALDVIAPQLAGRLDAEGRLSGTLTDPQVQLHAKADSISYQDYSLQQANADVEWNSQQAQIKINAVKPLFADWQGESIDLTLTGTPEKHQIKAMLADSEARIETELDGGWLESSWSGVLTRLEASHPWAGSWQSTVPAGMRASASLFELKMLCLIQQSAQICSSADWAPGEAHVSGEITDLPLKLLSRWLPEDAQAEGNINGKLAINQTADALTGNAELLLASGALSMVLDKDERVRLDLSQGVVRATFDPTGLNTELNINVDKNGRINGSALLASADAEQEQKLSGQMTMQLPDLRPLGVLIPDLIDIDGRLDSNIALGGTLAAPKLQGEVRLSEAATSIPALGVEFKELNLTVKTDDLNKAQIDGSMISGDGKLTLSGDVVLDPATGFPVQLNIQGKDFQIVQLPQAVAYISPDLQITIKDRQLQARGKVELPKATVEIIEIPASSVSVSDDQVIIDHQGPKQAETPPLQIDAAVSLILGDAVSFQGFGLKTRIEGTMDLTSKDGKSLGHGELSLRDGGYKAYGQDLTIEKGLLLFSGPLENPALDLQATRLSVDESVTAVLDVTGSLRKPLVTVASRPALPEEEALSYLVTGRGLGEEGPGKASMLKQAALAQGLEKSQALLDSVASGIGVDSLTVQEGGSLEDSSLVLGKYLSPDLYISYGVGLFDSSSALQMRYRLTEKLKLEAESGNQQSMDLIYQVEKN